MIDKAPNLIPLLVNNLLVDFSKELDTDLNAAVNDAIGEDNLLAVLNALKGVWMMIAKVLIFKKERDMDLFYEQAEQVYRNLYVVFINLNQYLIGK